ncbi:cupin domain-containing protein [Adhaeretor mobilis]|uniref:Cupin domain protein n=1 Tax=Adhaeretor mobilis TaxID=1930276 RepID=A0A517MV81_9BACT|nr:cupin domain-containing protein [Adhaeretor mobilis]QDS98791.1 Cupin domain protein [Adhaeretor mobilis]
MATIHAKPNEAVDVKPYGAELATAKTTTLFKTDQVELIRLVMNAGKIIPEHEAPGEIIVQCLEGHIEFTSAGKAVELTAGKLLYLNSEAPHAVRCIEDASFLVTILLNR